MNIRAELNAHKFGVDEIKAGFDYDSRRKISAILDILEIGDASVAHAKLILHTCEDMLDKCSVAMGTKKDV